MSDMDFNTETWTYKGARLNGKSLDHFFLALGGVELVFSSGPNGKKGTRGSGVIGARYSVEAQRSESGVAVRMSTAKWLGGERDLRHGEWIVADRQARYDLAKSKEHKALQALVPHVDPEAIEPLRRAYHKAAGRSRHWVLAEIVAAVTKTPTADERAEWRRTY